MDLSRHLTFGAKIRYNFQFVAQSIENGKSKCVYIPADSKYCIQRTLLRNRLVITNIKVTKTKTKALYDNNIHADVFAARDHLNVKLRDIDPGLFFSPISSFTSCLFSLEIFNTKLKRYPENTLYARNGSRSCKNIAVKGDT